jgi:CRISPR-associated protein Csm5
MNKNYSIHIKTLSPVHIGAGTEKNWQRAADFVHTNGHIYILDQRKVWLGLTDKQQAQYIDWLGTGRFAEVERMIVDSLNLKTVATSIFEYNGKLTSREIKTVLRNGNNEAYIPGSSIKGAIASALHYFLYEGIKPQYYNDKTAQELLGIFDRALGRFLRPSDSSEMATEVNDVDLYNLYSRASGWRGDFKDNFRIVLETFKENTEGSMRLSLATDLAHFIEQQKGSLALPTYYKHTFGEQPLENIFKIINNYTRVHLQRELAYFKKYNDHEDIDPVIDQLEDLQKDLDSLDEQTCLLRLSFGSGFHGITGDWRFKDHSTTIEQPDTKNRIYNRTTRQNEPARYKSRRLVFPFSGLLGFIKLTATPSV